MILLSPGYMPVNDRPYFRRILEFDDLVRRGRPVTCSSLAARWETSTKTVQRFVEHLRTDFDAPVVFDRRKRSFRYSDPEWRLPWLDVNGRDLFAIGIASKVFQIYEGTPVVKDLKAVFERIARILPESIRVAPSSLVEKLWIHPQPLRAIVPEVWESVANSLREKTRLEIDYRKPGGEEGWRTVEPYVLAHMDWDWFLVARDADGNGGPPKTFYLARIRSAKNTPFRFTPDKDFDPAKHFGDSIGLFVGGKPFRFRVRIAKEIAPWVEEVRYHPSQKLEKRKNGDLVLDLPAGSLTEARRFALSFGKRAKALSPKALVEEMRAEAKEMAKEYAGVGS